MAAAARRISALASASEPAVASAARRSSDDDVVVVSALRTAICKAKRGAFKDTSPDVLLSTVMRAVLDGSGFPAEELGDICVGNVLQPGGGAIMARIAQFSAGIPESVPLSSVNRQCRTCHAGLGCGVESMSKRSMTDPANMPDVDFDELGRNQKAADCLLPMGITSENVAEKFGVDRATQDAFAAGSQARAAEAQQQGLFAAEIVPVHVEGAAEAVMDDDGIRPGTTQEKLSKLRPAFKPDGTTTAGNSSQVSDGAAAVLVMRRWMAKKHGLPVLGVVRSYSVVGVDPSLMGIGPAVAIPEAINKAGISLEDVDIFEINEAFASQAAYCVKHLNVPAEKVNPLGGAIALGHPLGCTGARMVATLLHQMKRRKARYGVVSMCIGTGMGAAAVFEHEV
ncbi:ACAA1 [Symbiodinium sp. KB8]|nr:ACAA1 [Symbiodinium sp. KB8]